MGRRLCGTVGRRKLVLGRYRSAESKGCRRCARCLHPAGARQEADVDGHGRLRSGQAHRALSRRQADAVHRRLETGPGRALRWLPLADGDHHLAASLLQASHHAIVKGNRLVADPLLVYAELLFEGRERERKRPAWCTSSTGAPVGWLLDRRCQNARDSEQGPPRRGLDVRCDRRGGPVDPGDAVDGAPRDTGHRRCYQHDELG